MTTISGVVKLLAEGMFIDKKKIIDGKGEIARYEQFLLFLQCFYRYLWFELRLVSIKYPRPLSSELSKFYVCINMFKPLSCLESETQFQTYNEKSKFAFSNVFL